MKIKRKLWKTGKSLVITIDKTMCEMLNLSVGDYVEFTNVKKFYTGEK